jgi:hypothetical protein
MSIETHTHAAQVMVASVAALRSLRPDWIIAYDFPGIVAAQLPSGAVYVTGDANETYTLDSYVSVRAFEDGTPGPSTDLRLRVDDPRVTPHMLATAFASAVDEREVMR